MSSTPFESAPSFSEEEVRSAEAEEQQAFEAQQQQYLRKRVISLRAENNRLRQQLDMMRAQAAGLAEPSPEHD